MGNLPFYVIEHKRALIPLAEWDTLFANAEFEYEDMVEQEDKRIPMSNRTRARQCKEEDFSNDDATKAYYGSYKQYIMLCPAQDKLHMQNSLDDPAYRRRFNFIVRPRYVADMPHDTHTAAERKAIDLYVNDLQLRQGIKDNIVDYSIYGAKPVVMDVRFNGRVQLQSGREIFGTHELQW